MEELHGYELKGHSESQLWIWSMILRLRMKKLGREMPHASKSPGL